MLEEPTVSLSDVHRSIPIPQDKRYSVIRRLLAFSGPAYLVSVGYIDPGNWATDLEGGSRFGYDLIWVLVMANLMAILLQTLSARLGIVSGRDLAQACRDHYSKPVSFVLWMLSEIAIGACDLAEVLGTAIALNLLFGLQLIYGVILTAFDVLLLLGLQRLGMRKIESVIVTLVFIIGAAFFIEMFFAKPDLGGIVAGIVPKLNDQSLFVAIGILGATVMPHNLYLHSALVQTRHFADTPEGKREACKFNLLDSTIALNGSLLINGAILVLAAAVFFSHKIIVTDIAQAYQLLSPMMGRKIASILFAVALLASGQSSTITGTMAGQIVMEGFIRLRIRPVFRRLFTRALAIIPAVLVLSLAGDGSTYYLLLLSQVLLSMQLAFAIIPLIHFTSAREIMGEFANRVWVRVLAWLTAAVIIVLNAQLLFASERDALASSGTMRILGLLGLPVLMALGIFLLYIAIAPFVRKWREVGKTPEIERLIPVGTPPTARAFHRIGVAVERSERDEAVVHRALALAGPTAEIVLIHVSVSVGADVFGKESSDSSARLGKGYLRSIEEEVRTLGVTNVHSHLGFGDVSKEIVRIAQEEKLDVLVMGAHGHRGLEDLVLGVTISGVRHALDIPILVVK